MKNNWYSISEAADLIGVSSSTLRLWDSQGKFKPNRVLPSGKRYYSGKQIQDRLNELNARKSIEEG